MVLNTTLWTSNLFVQINDSTEVTVDEILSKIKITADLIEEQYSSFPSTRTGDIGKFANIELDDKLKIDMQNRFSKRLNKLSSEMINFITYDKLTDFTGLLKGYFLDQFTYFLDYVGFKEYLVNFGGDIVGKGVKTRITNKDFKDLGIDFSLELQGNYKVFSSGNYGVRGKHIKTENEVFKQVTVVCKDDEMTCTMMDMIATSIIADPSFYERVRLDIPQIDVYAVNLTNKLILVKGQFYVASPFFNEKEIEIRDAMIENIAHYFRPDQTDDNKEYDANGSEGHTEEVAKKIMMNNVTHIQSCSALVFPENTDDVGTLFEVGYALKLSKPIIRYNKAKNSYTVVDNASIGKSLVGIKVDSIIDCRVATGPIALGYLYPNPTLHYYLGDIKDNLMICTNFIKVEKMHEMDTFKEVEANVGDAR